MLLSYKLLAALLIFLVSIATVIYPLKRQTTFKYGESIDIGGALASGIFLGAAFFHLLPDAIRLFAQQYPNMTYPTPEVICIAGFVMLLFLERLSLTKNTDHAIPYMLAVILVIHAITEGTALGMGMSFTETLLLFVAIMAHKGSESFALCVTMLRHKLPFTRVVIIIFLFSLMTPLGIMLGTAVNLFMYLQHGETVAACFNAFTAGSFLYISTLHHTTFHKHESEGQGLLEFFSLCTGVATMALIALWT